VIDRLQPRASPLSESLREILDQAYTAMNADSLHRLPLLYRKEIYDCFGRKRTRSRYRSRTWLAIIAARRVYPIAAVALPDAIELLDRWLEIATALVEQRLSRDSALVRDFVLPGFTALMRPYPEDENDEEHNSLEATCAFMAAYDAACEAIGDEGFDRLDGYSWRQPDGSELPGELMPDEELVSTGAVDAEASAAVAEAWSSTARTWDADRQYAYWNWWLHEAVPEAYALRRRRIRALR
jgi:Immunity protein Imm5